MTQEQRVVDEATIDLTTWSLVEQLSLPWADRKIPQEIGMLFKAAMKSGLIKTATTCEGCPRAPRNVDLGPDVLKGLLLAAYELGRADSQTH